MGRKRKNEIGNRYGQLEILKLDHIHRKTKQGYYLCRCDCGNEKVIGINALRNGSTKACGCLQGKDSKWKFTSTKFSRLHKKWVHMISRCNNQKDISYKNYGARGIRVCKEWENDFDCFAEWALKNGYKNELEIDRIDNDKGYCPTNCRFVSKKNNNRNRRNTKKVTHNDIQITLGELSEQFGIKYKTLWQRIYRDGLTVEQAIQKNGRERG